MAESGGFFNGLKFYDPLFSKEKLSFIFDKEINSSIGSGINPVCPAYYADDFILAAKHNISRKGFITNKGLLS